jgi:hypothetical protein
MRGFTCVLFPAGQHCPSRTKRWPRGASTLKIKCVFKPRIRGCVHARVSTCVHAFAQTHTHTHTREYMLVWNFSFLYVCIYMLKCTPYCFVCGTCRFQGSSLPFTPPSSITPFFSETLSFSLAYTSSLSHRRFDCVGEIICMFNRHLSMC